MAEVKQEVASGLALLGRGAGLLRAPDRTFLAVRGDDRTTFLQGMLSNDVAGLRAGEGNYALLLTDQARVVAELRALACEEEIWLDLARARAPAVRAALERYVVADDVEIEERPGAALAVRGAGAAAAVARAAALPALADLAECGHARAAIGGEEVIIERTRDVGVDGFLLRSAEEAALAAVEAALLEAGVEAVAPAAVEAERLRAGLAREGVDFDEGTLAAEVPSLGRAISFHKGCYLGQEVLERVAARGRARWLVVGIESEGELRAGAAVRRHGAEVGRVSSAATVPPGRAVAMARLRAEAAEPGTVLEVAGSPARVREYPPLS